MVENNSLQIAVIEILSDWTEPHILSHIQKCCVWGAFIEHLCDEHQVFLYKVVYQYFRLLKKIHFLSLLKIPYIRCHKYMVHNKKCTYILIYPEIILFQL